MMSSHNSKDLCNLLCVILPCTAIFAFSAIGKLMIKPVRPLTTSAKVDGQTDNGGNQISENTQP